MLNTTPISLHAILRAGIIAAACIALYGCSSSKREVSFAAMEGSPFDPEQPARYVVYPGDVLLCRFPSDPTLDQQVRIRTDGKISLPHVGDVPAAQRTPEELSADLSRRYEGVLKQPEVTVIVSDESGRRVYIGGQVRTPGSFALHPNQTVSQAIFEAGGITNTAHIHDIIILRNRIDEGTYVLKSDLHRILEGKEPDIRLEPQDVIHVPETAIARVDRFVEQYINGIIPRAAFFSFTTELATQPVRVINQNTAQFPVSIRR